MILEAILGLFFSFGQFLINLLPAMQQIPNWIVSTIDLVGWSLCFFPVDCWTVIIANVAAWILIHWGWALISFVVKLIPGMSGTP